jgi:hypothetical protein
MKRDVNTRKFNEKLREIEMTAKETKRSNPQASENGIETIYKPFRPCEDGYD